MKKSFLKVIILSSLCVATVFAMASCGEKKEYDYKLSDYVKVADYKNLTYDKIKVSVSDKEIIQEINTRCENAATTKVSKKGTVKDGDTINVSFEGKINGKTFEGGSSDDMSITIGQTSMIDGFTEGLIGQKVGSTVTLNLKFPEDYQNKDVAGKPVEFKVTIKTKNITVVPDYNLDFVKANSKSKSLKEYEESVKDDLTASKRNSAISNVKNELWNSIVSKSEVIKYPTEKDDFVTATKDSIKKGAEQSGKDWKQYLKENNTDEKKLDKDIEAYAENKVLNDMIVYYIAREEGLDVTEKEYEDYIQNMLTSSGISEETFQSTYGMSVREYCDEQGLKTSLVLGKVMDKIFEYAEEK